MDRRDSPRIPDNSSVAVTVISAPAAPELEGQTFFCIAANISEGGLMIRVGIPVPHGSTIEMRVAFQQPVRSFDIVGKVAWVDPHGIAGRGFHIGIEFVSGKGRDLEVWREVVNRKILYYGADALKVVPPEKP
jgi:Tfp pilus assembly protein PilZ